MEVVYTTTQPVKTVNNVSVALEESAKVRGNYLNDVIRVILIMA